MDSAGEYSVGFDDRKITLNTPDGQDVSAAWEDLVGVWIQTTDEGPIAPDVFWVLGTKEHLLRFPQDARGSDQLLARLQQLPGFDNKAVIAAASCTENKFFECWTSPGFNRPIKLG